MFLTGSHVEYQGIFGANQTVSSPETGPAKTASIQKPEAGTKSARARGRTTTSRVFMVNPLLLENDSVAETQHATFCVKYGTERPAEGYGEAAERKKPPALGAGGFC
jgi:hypothetical protein